MTDVMLSIDGKPSAPASAADERLVRAIGLGSAVLMVIGAVIGSGIFLTTGVMAQGLPSAALLLAAWTTGGVLAMAGGLTYAEMGAMYPGSGGLYVFLSRAYGPLWGFLFGWAGLLVILTGTLAAVAVGFAEYFSYFFPALGMDRTVVTLPTPVGPWSIHAGQLVAAGSIFVLGAVNYVGVRSGNTVQATLSVIKIAALVMVPILAFTYGKVSPAFTPVVPDVPGLATGFGVAMIAVMWTYDGWYYVAFVAGEIKDPGRNVPRALVLGTLALTAMYVLVNLGYMYALTLDEMRGVVRIAERAAGVLLGAGAGAIVAAMVSISTFGCNAAGLIGTSRVCYAMAADGLFFRAAARVHPVYRTPHVAILLTCAWGSLLCLSGSYQQLFTYVIFASMLFFVAGGLAIFRLRQIAPNVPRPYRTWGYPLVPAVFVAGSSILVVNTLLERPKESLAGLGLVALGVPAYWYFRRQSPAAVRSGS